MNFRTVKLSELKPNPNNPRLIKDDKFHKLVKSIQDFPKMLEIRPIVVNSDMIVLGGNMRLKACKEAGLKEIPIIFADELTEEEQREFIIKDNVGFGEWDWEIIANEWDSEQLEEWGLDIPDFSAEEVLEAEEDDFDEAPPENPITVLSDLYEIGEHRLLCGDSTDSEQVARLMNGEKADMVFTDPPHDIEQKDFISYLDIFSKGVKFILHNDKYLAKLANDYIDRFERFFVHDFIFHIGGGNRFFTQNDLIGCFDYDSKKFNNLNDGFSTVIRKMTERQKGTLNLEHPHKKPIFLIESFIKHFSIESGIILDLYLGSGSTMVASHQLKRKCYGMELDPKYCDVIVRRMIKLDPSISVKRNGVDCKAEFE